ncbi:MAG: MgtC/SapB family protein [Eubacteriales bacterium]|nr:MgtC/SapB family protein [Eubacteriales bacterium]
MLSLFDPLRQFSFDSLVLRLLLALASGGVIGYGRSKKNCAAGLRTYMLISLGAALSIAITLYEHQMLHSAWAETVAVVGEKFDASRLAAQVVTGIGFLGAGTIIVTKKMSIKGLTTAAGLWTTGIVGLAAGSGFYEGALLGTALVLLTESTLARLGARIRPRPEFALDLLYNDKDALTATMRYCKDKRMSIRNLQIQTLEDGYAAYEATIILRGSIKPYELIEQLSKMPGIVSVSEA